MEVMRAVGVSRIVFSSICATYGEPAEGKGDITNIDRLRGEGASRTCT